METYYTPVKEAQMGSMRVSHGSAQTREGDWVCLNCNNLNFSFRKKCNRCKTQTRQQNQTAVQFLSYYEDKIMSMQAGHVLCACDQNASYANTSADSRPFTTPERVERTPEKVHKGLPSVSPLIKKYNAREETPQSDGRSEDSVWGVSVHDFEETVASSMQDEEEERQVQEGSYDDELVRLVNSILL